jgi:hypothetical protein
MRIGKLGIERDTDSVMSNNGWIGWWSYYLYIDDTLLGLVWQMITEFKDDKHMVG